MNNSWDMLEEYRGNLLKGEWPTITEMFNISLSRFPDRACFTSFDPEYQSWTYSEVQEKIVRLSSWLQENGLQKGENVALSGKNSPEWALTYLSVLHAGGVIVPLDYQMESERMLALMDFSEVRFVFIDTEKYDQLEASSLKGFKDKICLSPGKGAFVLDLSSSELREPVLTDENDLAAILYTSGTTGNEKGVMLTHANFMSDVFQACQPGFLTATEDDVWYALLPLHHSYAMTAVFLESVKHGSEVIFGKKMVVRQIMKELKMGKITMFMGIPLLFNKILKGLMKGVHDKGFIVNLVVGTLMRISGFLKLRFDINIGKTLLGFVLEKANLKTIRICISGGGPLAPETFRRYNELGLDFVQGYGLTETAPILTCNPRINYKLDSVGKIYALVDMIIVDPDSDGVGEIAVKGPNVTQGYYKDPENTKALFNEDGYLLTGDVGYIDKDNFLFLTGRKKSLIVTEGGKNVFPEEIEDHFQLFQQIEQVLILGYISDRETLAEAIEAVIYPSPDFYGSECRDPDTVIKDMKHAVKEVNHHLQSYKKISRIRIVCQPLEMTSTKKIKRPVVIANLDKDEQAYEGRIYRL